MNITRDLIDTNYSNSNVINRGVANNRGGRGSNNNNNDKPRFNGEVFVVINLVIVSLSAW